MKKKEKKRTDQSIFHCFKKDFRHVSLFHFKALIMKNKRQYDCNETPAMTLIMGKLMIPLKE